MGGVQRLVPEGQSQPGAARAAGSDSILVRLGQASGVTFPPSRSLRRDCASLGGQLATGSGMGLGDGWAVGSGQVSLEGSA